MPNKILLAERILLQTLCFDLQIAHPYRAILEKIRDKLKRECVSSRCSLSSFFFAQFWPLPRPPLFSPILPPV